MHVYIDESGNTGLNLFDTDQPYFLNVAMSSMVDFDDIFRGRVKELALQVEVDSLHGSVLGAEGVETIASRAIELVEFSQVRFNFAFVNKPDVAVIKFFDALFDPVENPAAPPHTYALRVWRLLLLINFSTIVDLNDSKLFWQAMTSSRSPKSLAEAVSAIDSVLQRIVDLPDERSKELIGETLFWARNHIQEFSIWTPTKQGRYGHLPNIFTFPALMEGISRWAKTWNSEVETIVHYQQSQFISTLRQWHSLFAGIEPERIIHFGDTPIQFADIQNSNFESRNSRLSPGLQLVDIVLWIFSRILVDKPLGPVSVELFNLCFSTQDMFTMSLKSLEQEAEHTLGKINAQGMSEAQLQFGKDFVERSEQLRQRRIKESGGLGT